ncbi:MAG: arginyltransferase [Myxococcales bacterium]|nr:arginyltransferase [Myxococcales bacterium]
MNFREVWNEPEPCPYLPDQVARMPLRVPARLLTRAELDTQLAAGDRRTGRLLYKTSCDACSACEPLRVSVGDFVPSKSQRRVWRRNIDDLRITMGRPRVDDQRVDLFNRHKLERGLSRTGEALTRESYQHWLVDSCCRTVEVDYWEGERLLAVSIVDVGRVAASSVYHYFDPDAASRSVGVFSALAELAWLKAEGYQWYYLGLFVRACDRLNYKADYRPHQRLVGGHWVPG